MYMAYRHTLNNIYPNIWAPLTQSTGQIKLTVTVWILEIFKISIYVHIYVSRENSTYVFYIVYSIYLYSAMLFALFPSCFSFNIVFLMSLSYSFPNTHFRLWWRRFNQKILPLSRWEKTVCRNIQIAEIIFSRITPHNYFYSNIKSWKVDAS